MIVEPSYSPVGRLIFLKGELNGERQITLFIMRIKISAHDTLQWIACGVSSEAARNETVFLLILKN